MGKTDKKIKIANNLENCYLDSGDICVFKLCILNIKSFLNQYFRLALHGTSFLEQFSSLVRVRDASGRTLRDIHDDHTALRRLLKLLDNVVAICRDVSRAIALQHNPLDRRLKKHLD